MATLTTEAGQAIDATRPADTEQIRTIARIEADAATRDGADALPKKEAPTPAAADKPKPRRGRPPKSDQARAVTTALVPVSDAQRGDGVRGLVQLGAGVCLIASRATGSDAFKADAFTLASRADDIAGACVETARGHPGFAAALDRVCAAGPYAALITVAIGVGSQNARNHRPSLALPGTVDPAKILAAEIEQEQADGAEAAA